MFTPLIIIITSKIKPADYLYDNQPVFWLSL